MRTEDVYACHFFQMKSTEDKDSTNQSPLVSAVRSNFTEGVDALIAAGCDVKSTTKELTIFSKSCDTEVLQVAQAIKDNDISRLETLVEYMYGSDASKKSLLNILFIAAAIGSTEVCNYLLACGFTPNALSLHRSISNILPEKTEHCVSPLALSMYYNRPGNIRLLLEHTSNDILKKCQGIPLHAEELLMKETARRLMKKYSSLQPTVVAGYEDGRPVLVVYSEALRDDTEYFCGKPVKFKNPRIIQKEQPVNSVYHSGVPSIAEKEMKIAERIINENGNSLWKAHSNLNIISMSSIKYVKGQKHLMPVCICLYCTSKGIIPLGEPRFPSILRTFDGNYVLPVDVREGYFEFCPGYVTSGSTTYHHKLKMGCSIGSGTNPVNGGGTLGPFVNINGATGFLTCTHVLFDITCSGCFEDKTASTKDVVQPAVGSMNVNQQGSAAFRQAIETPCGFVRKAVFDPQLPVSIDAALIQITAPSRIPTYGQFAIEKEFNYKSIGFDWPPEFNSGILKRPDEISVIRQVIKAGSETHLTRGLVGARGIQVRELGIKFGLPFPQMPPFSQMQFPMVNQIEIQSLQDHHVFFQPGDSGSAVFTMNDDRSLECIGMAIGFTSNYTAVVTPIVPILQALGPGVTLKSFP